MQVQSASAQIRYSLTRTGDGFLLSLWEETTVTETRLKPFLFKARHLVNSQEDARQILDYYLSAYQ